MDEIENFLRQTLNSPPTNTDELKERLASAMRVAKEMVDEVWGTTGDSMVRSLIQVMATVKLFDEIRRPVPGPFFSVESPPGPPARFIPHGRVCPHFVAPKLQGLNWTSPCVVTGLDCDGSLAAGEYESCLHYKMDKHIHQLKP